MLSDVLNFPGKPSLACLLTCCFIIKSVKSCSKPLSISILPFCRLSVISTQVWRTDGRTDGRTSSSNAYGHTSHRGFTVEIPRPRSPIEFELEATLERRGMKIISSSSWDSSAVLKPMLQYFIHRIVLVQWSEKWWHRVAWIFHESVHIGKRIISTLKQLEGRKYRGWKGTLLSSHYSIKWAISSGSI